MTSETAMDGEAQDEPRPASPAPGPQGIGGWLVIPIINLVTTIWLTGVNIWPAWRDWSGLLELLLNPESRWMFIPVVISLASGVAIIFLAAAALALMYLKKRMLPRLMIGYYCLGLAALMYEMWLASTFSEFSGTPEEEARAARDLFWTAVGTLIWVPYFIVSKRVKATFVN